jgi:hypothetical protein
MLIIRSILKLVHFVPNTDPWQKKCNRIRLPFTRYRTARGKNTNPTLNILYLSFTVSLQRLLNLRNFSYFDRKVQIKRIRYQYRKPCIIQRGSFLPWVFPRESRCPASLQ